MNLTVEQVSNLSAFLNKMVLPENLIDLAEQLKTLEIDSREETVAKVVETPVETVEVVETPVDSVTEATPDEQTEVVSDPVSEEVTDSVTPDA